ncbi:MAG: D-2-hydroxyacid dehydrogenase family protein [Alphaproteobacteria bacterium]|nr:D-2-hydroxyacid dehydrogenase family protein [Alphaproteobacteria bacterium]
MRVAILDDYLGIALESADWSRVQASAAVDVYRDNLKDQKALADRLSPYDVLVIMRERTHFPRGLLERLPKLKLLVTTSSRNRSIDLAACADRGVVACHTEGGHTPTMTWALILALAKRILEEDRATREGHWGVRPGLGLAGRTLGVVGLGKLGSAVARIGKAFDMRVIAWSQNLTDARAREVGVERVDKDRLLRESDFVTLHLVLSDRTRGLIGAADMARMKPTAYLINTSRGPLVDEDALAVAVNEGVIAGAGLDVFGIEPLPADHPLRTLPNSVVTPHVGGFVQENYRLWYGGAVEDILAWLDGAPIRVMKEPSA